MDEKEELELIKLITERGLDTKKIKEILDGYNDAITTCRNLQEQIDEMKEKKTVKENLKTESDDLKEMVAVGRTVEELKKVFPQEDTFKLVMAYKMLMDTAKKDDGQNQALLQKIDALEKAVSDQKHANEIQVLKNDFIRQIQGLQGQIAQIQVSGVGRGGDSGGALSGAKQIITDYKSLREDLKTLGLYDEKSGWKDKLVEGIFTQLGGSINNLCNKLGIDAKLDGFLSGETTGAAKGLPPAPEDSVMTQDAFDMGCAEDLKTSYADMNDGDIWVTQEGYVVGRSAVVHDWVKSPESQQVKGLKPYVTRDNAFVIPKEHTQAFLLWLRGHWGGSCPVSPGKSPPGGGGQPGGSSF